MGDFVERCKKHADDKRGARFISIFTKPSRNTQDEIPSYEWHVVTDPMTAEVSIGCKPAQTLDVLRQLIEDGVTECNQLAQEMRVTPGTISKWAKGPWKRAGWEKKVVSTTWSRMETKETKISDLRFHVSGARFRSFRARLLLYE